MRLFKLTLVFLISLISKSASSRAFFVKNVDYIVGVFEYDLKKPDKVTFLHQGVLINRYTVLTSSQNIEKGMNLKVRHYNWDTSFLINAIHKTVESDFQEQIVENYEFDILRKPTVIRLNLGDPFTEVISISNQGIPGNYLFYENPNCVLMKIKFKRNSHFIQEVYMKEKEIKPHRNLRPYKCNSNFLSNHVENPENIYNYYCVDEVGKSYCNSHGGSALVCQNRQNPKSYFVAGVNVVNDNCKYIFENVLAF